ncbi:hypothetical protein EVAR_24988_1 [Eumeta japonica]|uniref:Uncharacterized protein n=1 Tax=Eumeta variegata TaxID=151549 RepID=A0A4C1XI84_EUMVA|nr:hypothetical protein EVAR_24988_1 [Eumeta japonica]
MHFTENFDHHANYCIVVLDSLCLTSYNNNILDIEWYDNEDIDIEKLRASGRTQENQSFRYKKAFRMRLNVQRFYSAWYMFADAHADGFSAVHPKAAIAPTVS